jgi:hypothetical protein
VTHHILISDRQTRHLSDTQLLTRLGRQVVAGIEAGGRTVLVGGCALPQLYETDPTDMLRALRHPRGQHVTHHPDGSTDVVLTVGVEVHIHPAHETAVK